MTSNKPKNLTVPLIIIGAAFLTTPFFVKAISPNSYEGGRSRNAVASSQRNSSAIANIVGEFRASVSDIIFIKTERYLHGGVAYQTQNNIAKISVDDEIESFEHVHDENCDHSAEAHSEHDHSAHAEEEHVHDESCDHSHDDHLNEDDLLMTDLGNVLNEVHIHDENCDHSAEEQPDNEHDHSAHQEIEGKAAPNDEYKIEYNDEGAETLIPNADKDFRGFIGYLERNIRPWKDPSEPHVHSDGKELLPWYRIMTISDPHNVRAYVLGAYWLNGELKPDEAHKFLDEGIEKNPDSFILPFYKGRFHINDMRRARSEFDDQVAEDQRNIAIDYLIQASEFALEQRPKKFDMRNIDYLKWSLYEEEDATAAVRLCVILLKEAGRLDEALALAERAAPRFGYINEHGEEFENDGKLMQYIEELQDEIGVPIPLRAPSS